VVVGLEQPLAGAEHERVDHQEVLVDEPVGSSERISWPNRLRRDRHIEPRGPASARNRQLLGLTEEGSRAVDRWLEEPGAPYRIYDESLAKLYFANLAGHAATAELLQDQQHHHAELLTEFERIQTVLSAVDFAGVIPGQLYAVQLGIEVERAYLRWIRQTLTDLRKR